MHLLEGRESYKEGRSLAARQLSNFTRRLLAKEQLKDRSKKSPNLIVIISARRPRCFPNGEIKAKVIECLQVQNGGGAMDEDPGGISLSSKRSSQQTAGMPSGRLVPRTERGKKASRFNAVRTGLFAKHVVIPVCDGDRSGEQFPKLLADLQQEFHPEGPSEEFWVVQMAECMWRLRRATWAEKGSGAKCSKVERRAAERISDG